MSHRTLAVAALVAAPILPLTLTAGPALASEAAPATHAAPAASTVAHRRHLTHLHHLHVLHLRVLAARKAAGSARARVLAAARSYIGTPYVNGGLSRAGTDCSGLVVLAYKGVKKMPRTTQALAHAGRNVTGRAKVGDVLLYGTSHAAIVAAVSRGRVVLTVVARHSGTRVQTQRPYAAYTVRSVLT